MATFDVYNMSREKVSEIELSDKIFSADVKEHLLWETVRNQLANRRSGSAKVKTRSEVKATGAKPFKQKGTGRARQGGTRSPHHVGGGVAHGPSPRDYSYVLPKKVRKSALCSALSLRAKEENIFILEDLALEKVGTKGLKSVFDQFELKKALVVDFDNSNLRLSCRNLADFQLLPPVGVNVYDLLRFDQLVLTRKAAEALQTRLDPSA